jgi:hypothetical protein
LHLGACDSEHFFVSKQQHRWKALHLKAIEALGFSDLIVSKQQHRWKALHHPNHPARVGGITVSKQQHRWKALHRSHPKTRSTQAPKKLSARTRKLG